MRLKLELPDRVVSCLSIPREQVARLMPLHFRSGVCLAGNFSLWKSPYACLNDPRVLGALRLAIRHEIFTMIRTGSIKNHLSVEILLDEVVGWASFIPARHIQPRDLVIHQINRFTTVQKVANYAIPAPRTRVMTIRLDVKFGGKAGYDGRWIAHLSTMYPGKDVGRLRGNMTKRGGIVIFGWEHPGDLTGHWPVVTVLSGEPLTRADFPDLVKNSSVVLSDKVVLLGAS